jgi:uncharacterized protein involved in exopolysaccharide biosynthesis
MDVMSLLRLVVRHWRFTIPAALLTIGMVFAAVKVSPPTYQAAGSLVLVNPPAPPDDNGTGAAPVQNYENPYVRFNDLRVVVDVVARRVGGDAKREELAEAGVTGYQVAGNAFSDGPVIEVTGAGPMPEDAIRSAEMVLSEVEQVLLESQEAEGTDPEYFISTRSLQEPGAAQAQYGSTMRAAIGALALGGLYTLAIVAIAEAITQRRAARRGAPADPGASEAVPSVTQTVPANGSLAEADNGQAAGQRSVLRLSPRRPSLVQAGGTAHLKTASDRSP